MIPYSFVVSHIPDIFNKKLLQLYFEVSKKEAKQYIDMLPKEELKTITQQINGK